MSTSEPRATNNAGRLLALLPIAEELRSDFVTMVWVVLAYLLVNTSFVLSLGWIGDLYGRKRMYDLGSAVFTVGSVLRGLSVNAIMLVGFRASQGLGAALGSRRVPCGLNL